MLKNNYKKPKPIPKKKYKKAAWIVSNCGTHSEREHFVEELQKHFPVDIFGKCGSHECPESEKRLTCYEHIANDYMFYLSFENSICEDYVTEKFFTPMNLNILPLVLGGAKYSAIAPPKSYINVLDYPNPKELADYLIYLVNNNTAYEEYFTWKQFFKVYPTEEQYLSRAMCQLCETLNNENEIYPQEIHQEGQILKTDKIQNNTKIYNDMSDWWRQKATCKSKGSFYWSKPDKPSLFSGLNSITNYVVKQTADMIETFRDSHVIV